MNTQSKFLITLLCGTYFLLGCNNGSNSVLVKNTDSSKMKNTKSDTIVNKLNTDKIKRDDSILYSMNKMVMNMRNIKLSGNFDIDFVNTMIELNQGAIVMSLQEIKSGEDAGIKALAKEIVRNQLDEQSNFGNIAN